MFQCRGTPRGSMPHQGRRMSSAQSTDKGCDPLATWSPSWAATRADLRPGKSSAKRRLRLPAPGRAVSSLTEPKQEFGREGTLTVGERLAPFTVGVGVQERESVHVCLCFVRYGVCANNYSRVGMGRKARRSLDLVNLGGFIYLCSLPPPIVLASADFGQQNPTLLLLLCLMGQTAPSSHAGD